MTAGDFCHQNFEELLVEEERPRFLRCLVWNGCKRMGHQRFPWLFPSNRINRCPSTSESPGSIHGLIMFG